MMTIILKKRTAFFISLLGALCWGAILKADIQVGTLTQLEGDVKILSNPSKSIDETSKAPGTLVKFEGEYYRVRDAKIGDRLEKGNILRTTPSGKTRVIYDNGDQYHVGPATAFKITWKEDAKNPNPTVAMMYGKFRGIVEKDGPRTKMFVRTKSATMGVRGTDFFVADQGMTGDSEISVVRGSVEVKPQASKAKPVEVKAGFSVEVAPPPPAPKTAEKTEKVAAAPVVPMIELRKTTQEDLQAIQKTTEIKAPAAGSPVAEVPKAVQEKLQQLEKKAVETTLKDIKTHDPKMYEQIAKQKIENIDQVQGTVVSTLMQTAPKAPPQRKPYKSEIENLENGAYEHYFKEVM